MKVYLVTSGEYSSYQVRAVFTSEERAEAYMEAFPDTGYNGYNELAEYELDPFTEQIEAGLVGYAVRMRRDGHVETAVRTDYEPRDEPHKTGAANVRKFLVMARDEQHAIKIANERRIQMLTEGKWGEGT